MNTSNTLNATSTSNTVSTLASTDPTPIRFQQWHKDIDPSTYAQSGQRAVVLNYKAAAVGKNKGVKAAQDSFLIIPDHITPEAVKQNLDSIMPVLIFMLQKAEASLLRKEHVAGSKGFTSSWFTLDKIITYLEESGQSKRLSKEEISNWWNDSGIEDSLIAELQSKGMDDSMLPKVVEVYKAKVESLANPQTQLPDSEQEQVLKLLALSTDASSLPVGKAILSRIEKMVEAKIDILDAL